jgi:5-formyltetrahydrofolate cyclo-ligase
MSHPPISENDKSALRKTAIARRGQLPMPELSARIREQLIRWPVFQQAETILFYSAIRNEIELLPLAEETSGHRWYLPKVEQEGMIRFYRYQPGTSLAPGAYGVPEPPCADPLVTGQHSGPLLILVPGLLFDRQGYRLGYGKGYYDRFLNGLKQNGTAAVTVGASPGTLLVDRLPNEPHDVPVDIIITESTQFRTDSPLL